MCEFDENQAKVFYKVINQITICDSWTANLNPAAFYHTVLRATESHQINENFQSICLHQIFLLVLATILTQKFVIKKNLSKLSVMSFSFDWGIKYLYHGFTCLDTLNFSTTPNTRSLVSFSMLSTLIIRDSSVSYFSFHPIDSKYGIQFAFVRITIKD